MDRKTVFFLILVSMSCIPLVFSVSTNQSHFFVLMKDSFSGKYPSSWDVTGGKAVCTFTGVACNNQGNVVSLDVSGWSLSGEFPENICSYLPELRVLRLSSNRLKGNFPDTIVNCSHLEELNMSYMSHAGKLPDFSPLTSLKILDLSYNLFTGRFPMSLFNLSSLEVLNFNENEGFNLWTLPKDVHKLKNLKSMVLTTCMLQGQIPASLGNLTSLVDLELSGNFLTGHIPPELGMLKNLQYLELYYNSLVGVIPEELGNLMELRDFDLSVNKLTGKIPESICRLPKLEVMQLYNNSLTGEIPAVIENSTSLSILSIYDNFLSGHVPRNLGQFSELVVLDMSENQLSGPLPTEVCKGGKLLYFLVLDNWFSGELPDIYAKCLTLLRFRVSNNHLQGSIPRDLFGLPHVSIIDLAYNNFSGSISESIGNSRNLSELFIQRNRISGLIPPTISRAANLVKIDLSYNLLSGPIPSEIGNLKRLNSLMLQGNKLNSSIPSSFSLLQSLNVLDLSNNLLSGSISDSLSALLPNYINFSNNLLSGPIPSSLMKGGLLESFSGNPRLCVLPVYANSSDQNFPVCTQSSSKKRPSVIWVGAIAVALIIIGFGAVLAMRRRPTKNKASTEQDDESLSSSFFSYDLKSFHKLNYDRQEIIEAMVDKNIVGYGGSGTVYKIELKSGELVAVKKLWSRTSKDSDQEDRMVLDKELKNEVATLGNIRHKNIVKLYSYFTSFDFSLLVYEYMPNGNLWDALHKSWINLTWPTRHQIALGIAQGLSYIHHDLLPPIIHRDIKSTNILLDAHYQPKVADFGIAKVLQARGGKDSTTTVIAGTYGYLAPEYAYSARATTKCDVYSFGVILMELITGKKPVEAEFGENRNIVYWVSNKVDSKEGINEIIDERLSGLFREEIIQVIRIAIKCTYKSPANRPTMKEVVQRLIEADPCRFHSAKLSDRTDTK
ncbi:receptor protein-tyrosine kinase CEPR1-like [Neltuma alba]|uniref:receptor protein-tyrosine kinase CEPR1-like n=1 Tax=Neltuma alba TaxID=207710 RepID=UPI0010A2DC21|nr:receptor protein-tyrosine kinase CEPR1-like [Prosopis alba]XP_028802209.1 receptor protein-tyrosine kinase CEPR1-like [Prosopis alba]